MIYDRILMGIQSDMIDIFYTNGKNMVRKRL